MSEYLNKLKVLLKSRRFAAALLGMIVVVLQDVVGLDESQANVIAGLLVAWIVGDSLNKTE